MSSYQVIAKRFRPQKFSEVFEQEAIVQTIKNAIRLEKVGHAYLFCGTRGTGKTTLARLFAKAMNCENLTPENEPCNTCPSCNEITSGHSLDVIEIDGASNRGIDDIRNLNETVGYAASGGRYKIYIIDEVHMLTKEAFNALLKTLEEPPSHVIFFFATTEPHKVLPTILSRCQRFDLRRITPEKINSKLSLVVKQLEVVVDPSALNLIASHAEGSLRDAESLLDQLLCYEEPPITLEHAVKNLGIVSTDLFFKLDDAVKHRDFGAAFSLSETIYQTGCHLQHFLESLTNHFRTIALTQMGEKPPHTEYAASAQAYTKHHTLEILDYLIDALEKAQRTPFKRIHLEVALLHIIRGSQKIPLESLVERLENLKNQSQAPVLKGLPPVAAIPESIKAKPPTPKPIEEKAPPPPVQEAAPVEEVPFFPNPPPAAAPDTPPAPATPKTPQANIQQKIKHEQVMRFASVELNGSLKQ
ncbi:MAG: DNA polymerase III subunit gamma/tau [Simkaniaceae bacterium]|nr:MAG: DNA polymerase III subunit gamma/tau [Simkaniaceae bacterium]